ncbi:hypothetical protein FQN52_000300 [Onygenales sp. PD_12]|nr:hypothetical protein FQN52_000300 [Onygenales sp. PD_12]
MSRRPATPPPAYEPTDQQQQPDTKHPQQNIQQSPLPPLSSAANATPDLSDITLDTTLIYPTTPPATALYELSHELDAGWSTIDISRLVPRTSSHQETTPINPRDKNIYTFTQLPFSTTVEITGKRRSTLPGTLHLKSTRHHLVKTGWELWQTHRDEKSLLLKVKPTRSPEKQEVLSWEDGKGAQVAVETVGRGGERRARLQVVDRRLVVGDDSMMDVLITAWCARIWISCQLFRDEEWQREKGFKTIVQERMAHTHFTNTMR